MPHFPQPSQEISETTTLPTRERESEHSDVRRPQPSTTNDTNAQRTSRLRVQNRRRRYLELNPDYFSGSNLEQADPLLYDRLIRRFQSATEREAEGRARGAAGALEASLVRSEAKVEALAQQQQQQQQQNPSSTNTVQNENPLVYERGVDGAIVGLEEDVSERVGGKAEGLKRWEDVMRRRFLRGEDGEFEYGAVDEGEEYDDLEEEGRGVQEVWFEGEGEEFVRTPRGETGVQDF